jgi:biotin synthase
LSDPNTLVIADMWRVHMMEKGAGMDLLETVNTLTTKALSGQKPTRDEALAVLRSEDDDLMDVIAAAFRVRRRYFGTRVKLNFLVNLKSGLCPEDCFYCSQRLGSGAEILKYTWLGPGEAAALAGAGISGGARRVCLVASGRGPTDRGDQGRTPEGRGLRVPGPAL